MSSSNEFENNEVEKKDKIRRIGNGRGRPRLTDEQIIERHRKKLKEQSESKVIECLNDEDYKDTLAVKRFVKTMTIEKIQKKIRIYERALRIKKSEVAG